MQLLLSQQITTLIDLLDIFVLLVNTMKIQHCLVYLFMSCTSISYKLVQIHVCECVKRPSLSVF